MPPSNALTKIVIAIVLTVVSFVINPFLLVSLASTIFSILGCMDWARSKGLNPLIGLVGFFHLIGWIIMFFLPAATTSSYTSPNSNYPR